jgi:hypothetical protein
MEITGLESKELNFSCNIRNQHSQNKRQGQLCPDLYEIVKNDGLFG